MGTGLKNNQMNKQKIKSKAVFNFLHDAVLDLVILFCVHSGPLGNDTFSEDEEREAHSNKQLALTFSQLFTKGFRMRKSG